MVKTTLSVKSGQKSLFVKNSNYRITYSIFLNTLNHLQGLTIFNFSLTLINGNGTESIKKNHQKKSQQNDLNYFIK